jgi:hypothetical protein
VSKPAKIEAASCNKLTWGCLHATVIFLHAKSNAACARHFDVASQLEIFRPYVSL